MKKFTKIIICLVLCVVSLTLVACKDSSKNKKNYVYPTSSDAVSGNDGLAVQCGSYIYFVNGMKTVESMSNKKDTYTVGSLMVMKLDSNGQVIRDEDELAKDETYTTMCERLCGFESTGLFINGDYLYFTTPCLEDEGENANKQEWAKERVEFYRIKLDASTEPERVYQASVSYKDLKFTYYDVDGNTLILVYEQNESKDEKGTNVLVRVNANAKESAVISANVTSVTMDADYANICYVKNENSKYDLFGYNLSSNVSTDSKYTSSSTFTVLKSANNNVFISDGSDLYVSAYDLCDFSGLQTISNISKYGEAMYVSNDGEYFIGVKDAKIEIFLADGTETNAKVTISDAESLTVIGLENGMMYLVDNSNNVYALSYYDALENGDAGLVKIANVESLVKTYFDIDDNYVYFYKTVDGTDYLHRLALNSEYVEDQVNEELIGVK